MGPSDYADPVTVFDVIYWAICLVLVTSGAMKLSGPGGFASFISPFVGESLAPTAGRLTGAAELVLGFVGIAYGGAVVATAVAVTYAVFSVVVLLAMRRSLPTCGCFGSASAAPSGTHAAMNVVSVVVASIAVARSTPGMSEGLKGSGPWAVAAVVSVLAIAVLVVVVDTKPVGATVLRRSTHGGIDERSSQRRN